ncbi:P-loop containing nucleoside triphosphate hydrolase protein [Microstroma glucosiphilum]|uniref:P-loop containing nucleoside triphosphate hydrolase protein n=1 Tax=Pseudomicrostroma glucosiphilum TaxID=1684307 RepID=A0A316U724_9BASI|nr:P-loop containing nucleoside triphosphate hydrolase protein [Pseudomicrostroma glucosiphilum]PWN21066.1 P-loop containing nucleoside triphosphate hydrolase protein [Pseudomicrostroma glucosiphilum]
MVNLSFAATRRMPAASALATSGSMWRLTLEAQHYSTILTSAHLASARPLIAHPHVGSRSSHSHAQTKKAATSTSSLRKSPPASSPVQYFSQMKSPPSNRLTFRLMPPRQLVSHLDAHVVGQERAKRYLAVTVYNHFLRLLLNDATPDLRRPSEITRLQEEESSDRPYRDQDGCEREEGQDEMRKQRTSADDEPASRRPLRLGRSQQVLTASDTGGDKAWRHVVGQGEKIPSTYFSHAQPHLVSESKAEAGRSTQSESLHFRAPHALRARRPLSLSQHEEDPSPLRLLHATSSAPRHAKSNLILIGPSGSGKTLLISTVAEALDVPFVSIDATTLTSSGYVGEDVDVVGRRLLSEARRLCGEVATEDDIKRKAEQGIVFIDEVDKLAKRTNSTGNRDIGGEGVQQALLRLLEGCVMHVQGPPPTTKSSRSTRSSRPKSVAEASSQQSQQEVGDMAGTVPVAGSSSTQHTYQIDTTSVLFVTSGAFVGLESIMKRRYAVASGDKGSEGAGLRRVNEEDLIQYGLIPEFIGRIPAISVMASLTQAELVRVMTEPRDSLLAQYTSLLSSSNVAFKITSAALESIARQASASKVQTGARSLKRILEDKLLDTLYAAPGGSIRFALLDEEAAEGRGDVKVWSRGGKQAFANAYDDEERSFVAARRESRKLGRGEAEASTDTTRASFAASGSLAKQLAKADASKETKRIPSTQASGPQQGQRRPLITAQRYIDPETQQLIDEAEAADWEGGESDTIGDVVVVSAKSSRSPRPLTASQLTGLSESELSTIARRKSRARLNRPSRVGNLRVVVGV